MTPVKLPSWLNQLRKMEVIDVVKSDPRSFGGLLLGLKMNDARRIIDYGQANFDKARNGLLPNDLVLLYAYINQKRHIEELVEAFSQHYKKSHPLNLIVVDVGCGPFTGGLALAATLEHPIFDYIGVDPHESMRSLGKRLASSKLVPGQVKHCWACSLDTVEWSAPPGWSEVVVIISFVFASPTLDVDSMFKGLMNLLSRLGHGPVTLLYTNSPREEANKTYPAFRNKLIEANFRSVVDSNGRVVVERLQGQQNWELRYAMFRRNRIRKLDLGD